MSEPHQRVQSGKLRPAGRQIPSTPGSITSQSVELPSVGIVNANDIELYDPEDTLSCFMQTPTSLCNYQISILNDIAQQCSIDSNIAINKEWRNTWNIGTWNIGSQVSISVNMMQPNIASTWANIVCSKKEDLEMINSKYSSYQLEKATYMANINGEKCQIQGRWTLHAIDDLLSINAIKKESLDIGGLNVCQSRIFIWLLVGDSSEYLCTLTQESIGLLARYIPDWCLDIQEPTKAKNITLRVRNPQKLNDASSLSITPSGWIQFNGRIDNASKVYSALITALRKIIVSIQLKPFLESLHYDALPQDF